MKLERYDAAIRALAEATRIDEVKSVRDKSMGMRVYAEQAKDIRLLVKAVELRKRAERKAGQLLIEMKERGERESGKGNRNPTLKLLTVTPKLSDLGISKTESSRWQALARLDDDTFQGVIDVAVDNACSAIARQRSERRRKSEKKDIKRAVKTFGPVAACAMHVRRIILEVMDEMPRAQWSELLTAVREQLDEINLKLEAPDDRHDGHYPARESA